MVNKGWECPKCGACYAPTVKKCKQCNGTIEAVGKPLPIPDPTVPFFPSPLWVDPPIPPHIQGASIFLPPGTLESLMKGKWVHDQS